MTEIWFDERDDAETFLEGLELETEPRRVGFAGEEDDEDHAWVVLLDHPDAEVMKRADELGGWVPEAEVPVAPAEPLDLPAAPRRLKNPDPSRGR
ncbi:hypothetical protein BHE97_00780 [Aeromicrobium sp. PE09-221]|uniref:hypothetical protein n=1 Tax=Aeromicrobium sp. PE09-221 TaxID=1898043 RepID=UPI000B3EA82E|nr:hypothetical protein [Aeromicrobium sp. PE09-221]OUZ12778.1 hypothetical protein BHE97_00780 [Aeromicrobium sp. PE09-221]